MNKTILVTGAAGFIASNFCNIVTEKYSDAKIVGFDKMSYCSSMKNLNPSFQRDNFSFFKGNLTKPSDLEEVFTKNQIDWVIHFAAYTHVDNSFENPVKFTKNNVLGTHHLLEYALKFNVTKFVFVSTDEVYGSSEGKSTERTILEPTNPYSATKAAAEMLVQSYYTSYKLPIIITRSNNIYGPNQYPDKIIPIMINNLSNREKITIHGSGNQVRSFLYVDDVVDAYISVLQNGRIGETYNISSQDEISMNDLGVILLRRIIPDGKFEDYFLHGEDRLFNDVRYHICSEKIEKELNWKQKTSFPSGLDNTILYYTEKYIQ